MVYGSSLENWRRCKLTVGSNPTPSANRQRAETEGAEMFSAGIRNPERSVQICVVITLVAWASLAWGIFEMHATGQDTLSSGLKIGLAILPAILAPAMALNFWFGVKAIAALRRGENAIARWTVNAAEFAEFVASNTARNALLGEHVNDWTAPRQAPSPNMDVIFASDAVLVGDTCFALVTTGLFRFTGVQILSDGLPTIAFRTVTTYANRFGPRSSIGELRIPVARGASNQASTVVTHFQKVQTGGGVANPDFYRRRVRLGLIAAPICFVAAAVGFALQPKEIDPQSLSVATLVFAVGLVFGIAALILAIAAKLLDSAQRRRR